MTNLLIIEDQDIVLKGLQLWLSDNYPNITTCKNPSEAITLYRDIRPSLVILDIRFKDDSKSGIDLCKEIMELDPRARIVMLSQYDQLAIIDACFKAGAMAYVNKADEVDEISNALEAALSGSFYHSTSVKNILLSNQKKLLEIYSNLPNKSKTIFDSLALGQTQKSVCEKFSISKSNYYHHVHKLQNIFQVEETSQLISIAKGLGIALNEDSYV